AAERNPAVDDEVVVLRGRVQAGQLDGDGVVAVEREVAVDGDLAGAGAGGDHDGGAGEVEVFVVGARKDVQRATGRERGQGLGEAAGDAGLCQRGGDGQVVEVALEAVGPATGRGLDVRVRARGEHRGAVDVGRGWVGAVELATG